MDYKLSGVTPSGRLFYRGEDILVPRLGHLLSARITEIGESDGEIFVKANVDTGVLNSMGGERTTVAPGEKQTALPGKFPPVEYEGVGYRHQSTKLGRGESGSTKGMLLFCFANEKPTFAMGDAPGSETTTPPAVEDVGGSGNVGGGSPTTVPPGWGEQPASPQKPEPPNKPDESPQKPDEKPSAEELADKDKSGKISGAEARDWNAEHPDDPVRKGKVDN